MVRNRLCYFKRCASPAFLFLFISVLSIFCDSHGVDNPSFKYSRKANIKQTFNYDHADFHTQINNETDMGEIVLYAVSSTLFISAAPFFLLYIIPLDSSDEMKPRLKVLLAFASGGLLGDAFLHLIPHATASNHIHSHSHVISEFHNHGLDFAIGMWVLCGIIAFLTVEKLVRLLKEENIKKEQSNDIKTAVDGKADGVVKNNCKTKKKNEVGISGYLNLAADFAHNFTDGLAIGASYLAGKRIGLVTTITILLHEIPHEIGDFAILIKSGCSRRKAMLLQLVTAFGALAGTALALIGGRTDVETVPWVLPFTAGGFIYIATVSVLPELLEDSTKLGQSIKEIIAILIGVFLMVFIAKFE